MAEQYRWWQRGVVYQIYPRSFQDSNGDGIGDLPGITARLDYLAGLRLDALWISPFFPSPMADFGYDVSDYVGVDPMFGTLDDFDVMLAGAHARGLRIILDLVPDHTSDQHSWFQEARASRDNPKRDWYIWHDPAPGGGVPNNWLSHFGGSAWEWDAATGQYYLHSFVKEQPDLNWRNPEVEQAMFDVIRFWLDRGVDGFRVDVMAGMLKDAQFRDNPTNPDWVPGMDPYMSLLHRYSHNQPDAHAIIARMRKLVDSYPDDRVLIGEIYLPNEQLMVYYGPELDEVHLPFNFQLIRLAWSAELMRAAVDAYEAALPAGAWPNWVLGNHDRHRLASRVGQAQARAGTLLLLTLRGTPTCYYGDELGMEDVPIPPEAVQDPWEKNVPGLGLGRDPERTPMQWDGSSNAGFTTGTPWLPVSPDAARVNVAAEDADPTSMLTFFRGIMAARRAHAALEVGSYRSVDTGQPEVYAYVRQAGDDRLLVVLNLGRAAHTCRLPDPGGTAAVLLSTHLDRTGPADLAALELRPDEGLLLAVSGQAAGSAAAGAGGHSTDVGPLTSDF
ncbi:MAG TPA: alpha-amylase family glycosyl hydrolase [Chloroflexia bacterium]|nr:alpha-amylase family glycosyl hydrolase [Chloroflexia bacterium]